MEGTGRTLISRARPADVPELLIADGDLTGEDSRGGPGARPDGIFTR